MPRGGFKIERETENDQRERGGPSPYETERIAGAASNFEHARRAPSTKNWDDKNFLLTSEDSDICDGTKKFTK